MAQECLGACSGDASGIADNPVQSAKIQRRRRDAGGTKGSAIVTRPPITWTAMMEGQLPRLDL
jgi:hypothetical protein